MSLRIYKSKRDFKVTTEPESGGSKPGSKKLRFVIQKHDATRLHFDLRLEMGGTLVSWAVPKGMPMVKGEKRLAIKVEDHPVSYIAFEEVIPKGQYGGGTVQVWDYGTYEPQSAAPVKELKGGKLHFTLHGTKLSGEWYLVRLEEDNQWLVIRGGKDHPKLSKAQTDESALSGKSMTQLAQTKKTLSALKAEFIEPMKARMAERAPTGDWLYEVKFDGFRALAFKEAGSVHLLSRTNHDLGGKFPDIAEALQSLRAEEAVVDGEIVALDSAGRSSFQMLQAYELGQERPALCYYVFDLLALRGKSLRALPLEERRAKLQSILPAASDVVRFSPSLGNDADSLLDKVRSLGMEGLIGKRASSIYEAGRRTGAWIKLKVVMEQEFVVGGYTEPTGSREHIGALLVGVHDGSKLVYAGKVGTGFNQAILRNLAARFKTLASATCPFADLPEKRAGHFGQGMTACKMKGCHWLKPQLVCQIKFAEWTKDARLRQPVYLGLREDKKARKVVRERSQS